MVVNKLSQRGLAAHCGITIGGVTKYLRGEVDPERVSFGVQRKLAEALGVTLDSLWKYYDTGEYASGMSVRDIESWLRSEAGQEDLPVLMGSLQAAGARWLQQGGVGSGGEEGEKEELYAWPRDELKAVGVSRKMLEKVGLTEEVLRDLERGRYDEEVVEAFSLVCNYQEDAVREAFEGRRAIEG